MALTFPLPTGGVNPRPRPLPTRGLPAPGGYGGYAPSTAYTGGAPDYNSPQVPQTMQRLSEQAALGAIRDQTPEGRFKAEQRALLNRRSEQTYQTGQAQRQQILQQQMDDRNANEAFQRETAMMRLRAQMEQENRAQMLAMLRRFSGGGGGGVDAGAEAATYGRAKDAIAGQQEGALKALSGQMARRGISGSGIEAASLGDVLTTGQGALGEVSRTQAVERQRRAQEVEDRNLAILANLFSQGRLF